MKRQRTAQRKKLFIEITSGEEVSGKEVRDKMGISLQHMHQLVCDMRSEGHEIWVINKGGRDNEAFYQYKDGPEVRLEAKDRAVELLSGGHFSFKQMAKKLFVAESTAKSLIRRIRKDYKVDKQVGKHNECYYKIVGEL